MQRYYAGAVAWASQSGIVTGVGAGKFDPNASMTREQMAAMIVRFAAAVNYKLPQKSAVIAFRDEASISSFAAAAVEELQMAGMISGKPDANGAVSFAPKDTSTRAEAAVLLAALLQGMSE